MTHLRARTPWTPFTTRDQLADDPVLLLLPYAGGGATWFRPWVEPMSARGVAAWPVQLPARETRLADPLPRSLDALVSALLDDLLDVLAARPWGVYGHSAGAAMSLALARAAQRAGLPAPRVVGVGAARPPAHPDPEFPIHRLSHSQLLRRVIGYGGVPPQLLAHAELVEIVLGAVRADLALVETTPLDAETLGCPVVALGGRQDASVPVDVLGAWQSVTHGPFRVATYTGGHFPDETGRVQAVEALARAVRAGGHEEVKR